MTRLTLFKGLFGRREIQKRERG